MKKKKETRIRNKTKDINFTETPIQSQSSNALLKQLIFSYEFQLLKAHENWAACFTCFLDVPASNFFILWFHSGRTPDSIWLQFFTISFFFLNHVSQATHRVCNSDFTFTFLSNSTNSATARVFNRFFFFPIETLKF